MHFMADQEGQTGLIWPLKWPAEDKFHHSPCSLSKAKIELLHDIRVNSIIDLIETCLNLLETCLNMMVSVLETTLLKTHQSRSKDPTRREGRGRSRFGGILWHSVASEAENHAHVS